MKEYLLDTNNWAIMQMWESTELMDVRMIAWSHVYPRIEWAAI